jgi:hypothetical protein
MEPNKRLGGKGDKQSYSYYYINEFNQSLCCENIASCVWKQTAIKAKYIPPVI